MLTDRILRLVIACFACAVALTACGGENQGFRVPEVDEIEPVAFTDFPGTVLLSESTSSESSSRTIDGAPRCGRTGSSRAYELSEPVLFSEVQDFYNDVGVGAGWEIRNTISSLSQEVGVHPNYVGIKQVGDRTHNFSVHAHQDGGGTFQIETDQLIDGFDLDYLILADPDHPFC